MPSGEKIGAGAFKQEVVGEKRKISEERGEKTLSAAERAQRIKELLEERARLEERNKEIEEKLRELNRQELESHIANPDEYAENVRKYNHDELAKINGESQNEQDIHDHIANPDEYWENVKKYNHDELQKVNAGSDDQSALEKARAYNEAHANEMYENWEDGQDLPQNETEAQWTAFYQNQGEEFGVSNEQPAVEQTPEQTPAPATVQATEQAPAETMGQTPVQAAANTAETGPDGNPTPEVTGAARTAESIPDNPEMPEVVKRLQEKSKNSKGFKKFLAAAATAVMIALVAAGIIKTTNPAEANAPVNIPNQVEQTIDDATEDIGEDKESPFDYESVSGIVDGYGEKGMFLSQNKGGKYDFAAGSEVAEVCDNDDHEMMKYPSRIQVECLADYIALMPENMQPEGFKGLSILEAEEKLQSLSDEEYDALFKGYGKQVEAAKTKKVELNGRYRNAYMRVIDSSKPVTHDNIELVQCVTEEHGTKATMYYWEDKEDNVIGYIIIKDDCRQGVSEESETDIYKGIEEIPQSILEGEGDMTPTNPGIPTVPTTPLTPDTPKPKDADNLVRIDNKINEEIADDIGTERIENYVNPGVTPEEKTAKPAPVEYQGVQPTIVQNNESKPAEEVTPTTPANNYSGNRGGANSGEYQPVQSNLNVQRVADTKTYAPPTTAEEVDAILDDMGIN